jgi:lipoyl(octanoyl) transferase
MTVPCNIARLGLIDYMESMELQERLATEVREGRSDGWILFLEHPHTYTFGRAGKTENLRLTPEQLEEIGASVYWVNRGGDVTYHGPGQLIGYTILNLRLWDRGPRWYVQALEASLIDGLAALGVKSETVEGRPGVWTGEGKLAAIGLHIAHAVTTHGFALNVEPDLDYFGHIASCGIADAGVTSMSRMLGRHVSCDEATDAVLATLTRHLDLDVREVSPEEMTASLPAEELAGTAAES